MSVRNLFYWKNMDLSKSDHVCGNESCHKQRRLLRTSEKLLLLIRLEKFTNPSLKSLETLKNTVRQIKYKWRKCKTTVTFLRSDEGGGEANQCMGWLGGHEGQRPMGKFGQDAGVTPLLFFKGHPGIFNDPESQDLGLTSHPKDGAFYSIVYRGVRTQQTTGWAVHPLLASLTPLPTATQISQEVSHPGTDQAQPCLTSVPEDYWKKV